MKLPRFFGKKRDHRRTGSQAWGSFGEGLFYAVLLVSGFVFGGLVLSGTVAYSPTDPDTVVLQHGYDWWMWLLTLLLPGALVAFGGSGVMRVIRVWGKSEEHRAASMGLSELLDTMGQAAQDAPGHPGVPTCENLVNSPGTILRYRLPLESAENWTLIGFGLLRCSGMPSCLCWPWVPVLICSVARQTGSSLWCLCHLLPLVLEASLFLYGRLCWPQPWGRRS